ncbi:hypothetical protein [Yoonia sp.]|nr:hypothetical protein [Yoonia sp.]
MSRRFIQCDLIMAKGRNIGGEGRVLVSREGDRIMIGSHVEILISGTLAL